MVNMYGAGKALNLRYAQNSFYPAKARAMKSPNINIFNSCGGNCGPNITINNGPSGKWAFWGGLVNGLFGGMGGLGGMFGGFGNIFGGFGNIFGGFSPFGGMFGGFGGGCFGGGLNNLGALNLPSVTGTQGGATSLANDQATQLANLNKLYGAKGFNIVANKDGTFSATDKSGNDIDAMNKTYEEMCKILGEKQGKVTDDQVTNDQVTDDQVTDDQVTDDQVTNDQVTDDKTTGKTSNGKSTGKTSGGKSTGGTEQTKWTAAEKQKPQTVSITFSIHTYSNNGGTATVTMPDGKTYTASINSAVTHNKAMESLSDNIRGQLKADGWTNVTLTNTTFKFKRSEKTEGTKNTQGTQETKNTPKAWTPEEKAKPRTLKITFSIHTMRGNYGSATVTTPDGKTHTVNTGISMTQQRAMDDLSLQMKNELHKAGWTKVTLENTNFNWSD